jgi:hypothetical protein
LWRFSCAASLKDALKPDSTTHGNDESYERTTILEDDNIENENMEICPIIIEK